MQSRMNKIILSHEVSFLFQLFLKKLFFISINNHKIIKLFGILQRFNDHDGDDK